MADVTKEVAVQYTADGDDAERVADEQIKKLRAVGRAGTSAAKGLQKTDAASEVARNAIRNTVVDVDRLGESLGGLSKRLDVEFAASLKAFRDLEKGAKTSAKGVAKAAKAAADEQARAMRQVEAAARNNAKRQAQLIEDDTERRLELARQSYENQKRLAKSRNEDIELLEQVHQRKLADIERKAGEKAERELIRQLRDRARAIENADKREQALQEVKHRQQLMRARSAGDDLTALHAAQERERRLLADTQRQQAEAAEAMKRTGAETQALGRRFDSLNDKVAKVGGRFGDVRARLGEVEDAFKVFSGLALLEIGMALADGAKKLYEWTDAGKAAKHQAEATAGAINGMVSQLKKQSDAAKVTRDAIFGLINAQVAQELASKGLTKTTADMLDMQAKFAGALRDQAMLREQGKDQLGQFGVTGRIQSDYERVTARVELYQAELERLNKVFDEQKAQLGAASTLLGDFTKTIDTQGGAAKKTAKSVQAIGDSSKAVSYDLYELGRVMEEQFQAGLLPEPDTGAGTFFTMLSLQADQAVTVFQSAYAELELFDAGMRSLLGTAGDLSGQLQPALGLVDGLGQGLAQSGAAAILSGKSFQEMSKQVVDGVAMQAVTLALLEAGKAAGALAVGFFTGAPNAFAAAKQHGIAAAVFGGIGGVAAGIGAAIGGGGGGGGESAAQTNGGGRRTIDAVAPSGGGAARADGPTIININGDVYDTQKAADHAFSSMSSRRHAGAAGRSGSRSASAQAGGGV